MAPRGSTSTPSTGEKIKQKLHIHKSPEEKIREGEREIAEGEAEKAQGVNRNPK